MLYFSIFSSKRSSLQLQQYLPMDSLDICSQDNVKIELISNIAGVTDHYLSGG